MGNLLLRNRLVGELLDAFLAEPTFGGRRDGVDLHRFVDVCRGEAREISLRSV